MNIFLRTVFMCSVTVSAFSSAIPQEVVRPPQGLSSLQSRWEWAKEEVKRRNMERGVWIGYSIDRLMGERSWIGSFDSFRDPNETTLFELITGQRIEVLDERTSDESVKETARQALSKSVRKKTEPQVIKEVVFLFGFKGDPSNPDHLWTIRTSNITLVVDLAGFPLVWLGKAQDDESLAHLEALFPLFVTSGSKEKIIQAVGIHKAGPRVFRFLSRILGSKEPDRVRKGAAFWLGQQDTEEAMKLLMGVARNEKSRRVSENAVFAISQMSLNAATESLIDLGRNAEDREVRKKSVFWLGQRASERVVEKLQEFAYTDKDEEIQKQAVFALSQLKDGEGVTQLIKIAKSHLSPRIRKQAIFALGECDDPRAFEAIVEIARGR